MTTKSAAKRKRVSFMVPHRITCGKAVSLSCAPGARNQRRSGKAARSSVQEQCLVLVLLESSSLIRPYKNQCIRIVTLSPATTRGRLHSYCVEGARVLYDGRVTHTYI